MRSSQFMGACPVKQIDDGLRRAGLAEPWKYVADAVVMRGRPRVGHGVDGERDVEAGLIGLPRRRFNAGAGGDARYHDLRYAAVLELAFERGARKRAPCPFRDHDVAALPAEFRKEVGPAIG